MKDFNELIAGKEYWFGLDEKGYGTYSHHEDHEVYGIIVLFKPIVQWRYFPRKKDGLVGLIWSMCNDTITPKE
jgi:hypothetical protein